MEKEYFADLMNVRAVARYLGINEKKIYFLAKAGQIPCTRVTGKWTFPKKLIDQWIEHSASGKAGGMRSVPERSFLLAAGSDDPSLGILHDLYEAQTRPASFFMTIVGSSGGLAAIRDGTADFATAHLLEPLARSRISARVKIYCRVMPSSSSFFIASLDCWCRRAIREKFAQCAI